MHKLISFFYFSFSSTMDLYFACYYNNYFFLLFCCVVWVILTDSHNAYVLTIERLFLFIVWAQFMKRKFKEIWFMEKQWKKSSKETEHGKRWTLNILLHTVHVQFNSIPGALKLNTINCCIIGYIDSTNNVIQHVRDRRKIRLLNYWLLQMSFSSQRILDAMMIVSMYEKRTNRIIITFELRT